MQITSIETTPNPNSMKLNLDQVIGKSETYTPTDKENCPDSLKPLLDINGVQSIFVCHDFLTINRDPRVTWQPILEAASLTLCGSESTSNAIEQQRLTAEKEGQISVFVQTFRGIPIQVKALGVDIEKRMSMGWRFDEAAQIVQRETGADYLKERYWANHGTRYGDIDDVATEVLDEIAGTIDDKLLAQLVLAAIDNVTAKLAPESLENLRAKLYSSDWHIRLKSVQDLSVGKEGVSLLIRALQDDHPQVRRLAAAALGASENTEAVLPLCQTLLHDQSVGVRRTAGDALSDLGDISAQPAVCKALLDANKLVRWRAARYLAAIGTTEALPYLIAAQDDPEFEVRLEIEAAIQRISGGLESSMPVWKRILESS